ncbi:hypothetical protein K2173_000330 [Erythroxylum novogranatense]|uniref:Small RNA 2'-O-methyltransferase n=1 Tax=Erythroxylum novogranatense TaxID=1862640 RepID=A0AAV8SXG7_9ROSI|nr:hypothetical protein K2173_000330 [Erythroxylum novogranatense]
MGTEGTTALATKRTNLTPKAIIYQKFGGKACYKVEEVQECTQNGCPGLAIPQKGPSLYRCRLELPEFVVVSGMFKKKKDAEQDAADVALKQLGICPMAGNPTEQDLWHALSDRISYVFSDEFLSSLHPLSGHIKASLRRRGDLYGSLPASVITICDAKLSNLCKLLNPKVESDPFLALPFVLRAAATLSGSVTTPKGGLAVLKQNPYCCEIVGLLEIPWPCAPEDIFVQAIDIPSALDKPIEPVTIKISAAGYYLDDIAKIFGFSDASKILLSRTIGKASSETRMYFAAPESYLLDLLSDPVNEKIHFEGSVNARASYLCGQNVYGDAIMASIGYTWRSKDLFYEDLSLQSYYRMLISKTPSGIYKLSREAILAADLPFGFTTKTNWRGSFPREILCTFCRHHRLSEPVFSTTNVPLKASCKTIRSPKKLRVAEAAEELDYANERDNVAGDGEPEGSGSTFRCEVKIFSKFQELIIECFPKESYKKQSDATHNASLKILAWLNAYFNDIKMPLEKLNFYADQFNIRFYPDCFLKEFISCPSFKGGKGGQLLELKDFNSMNSSPAQVSCSFDSEGSDSGVNPSTGSLLCISYVIYLVAGHKTELLENKDEFEFETGTGAVISPLETVLSQMSVGQSNSIILDLPPQEIILAAAEEPARILPLLSSNACHLDYSVTLLRVTEPPEERMEQAFFSPPLSRQRVEYALEHISNSFATTLIDFGCGSGSLLDSLLDYPTSLEKVVGVDISQKSLSRAAKILHTKLSTKSIMGVKFAALYDGSITDMDSRLCGFNVGTCLEVIEHMEEHQASLFGDVALSYFRPKVLIISTPNYEYNVILQKSAQSSQEDPDDKSQSQSCKFRNHDHKFEWTREEFNNWASELARRHNYSVEFSGVGGSADVEPGFASQIAVFKREQLQEDDLSENDSTRQPCKVIWEWNSGDFSKV